MTIQNFAADLTVLEEATELLNRLASKWSAEGKHARDQSHDQDQLPMFSSCCPAWVRVYINQSKHTHTVTDQRSAEKPPRLNSKREQLPQPADDVGIGHQEGLGAKHGVARG